MESQGGGYVCNCVRLVLSRADKNGRLAAQSYVLLLYALCAYQGACMTTFVLYLLGQSTRVTMMSHSLEKVFIDS